MENKRKEVQIYDNAISEIERNFGSVIFSAKVFDDNNQQ